MIKVQWLWLTILCPTVALTQVPNVVDAPISARPGSEIQIVGSNFHSDPSANVVHFGAVRGVVTSADANSLSVTVPHGAVHGPITVTVDGRTGYSPRSFFPTFAGAGGFSATSFAARIALTSGANTVGTSLGDFNQDGKAEIVGANYGTTTVSVFKNSTSGGISASSFSVKSNMVVGLNPRFTTTGDVDGDGRLDLIAANHSSHTVSIYRNTSVDDNISFAPRVDFATGLTPYLAAIGDLDGDGRPDLVVANAGGNSVSLLRNTSTPGAIDLNSFAARVDIPSATAPRKASLCDVDGDGKLDVLVANDFPATVSIFRNVISGPGAFSSGSFAPRVDFATGARPQDVVAGDLDGDGKPDLAVPAYAAGSVSVLKNLSTAGTISFAPRFNLLTGGSTHCVAFGDVDGNGKLDIVAVSENAETAAVFRNIGTNGVLTNSSFAAVVSFPAGHNPGGVSVGDLDNDGRPDVVAGNFSGTVSVLRNQAAMLAPPTIVDNPTSRSVFAHSSVTFAVTATGSEPLQYQWRFNLIPIPNETNSTLHLVDVIPSHAGTYDVTVSNSAGQVTSTPATLTVNVRLSDFNNDGFADILWQRKDGSLAVWYMSGTTNLSKALLNHLQLPSGWNVVGQADFNRDGSSDLLLEHKGSSQLAIWLLSGTNLVESISLANQPTIPAGARVAGLNDFNGDGFTDILWEHADGRLKLWFLEGATFSSAALLNDRKPLSKGWRVAVLADLNGDGSKDILFQHTSGNLAVWYMSGTSLLSVAALDYGKIQPGAVLTGTADFNNDGHADLVWQKNDGPSYIWIMNGATRTETVVLQPKGPAVAAWNIVGPR